MDNYILAVFDTDTRAADGLHALWRLDDTGDITVHGAAVLRRNALGTYELATKHTDPGLRTALGVTVGALVGALAGPAAAAAGASAGAAVASATAAAAGVGAFTGGTVGLTADMLKSSEHDEAAFEARAAMRPGQAAVLAEISEDWPAPVDAAMQRVGARVYRRPKSEVADAAFDDHEYGAALYPYDYTPTYSSSR